MLEERARLARELHDAVSQRLFSIRLHARAAEVLVAKDPARAVAELGAIAELGAQAHGELRAVIDGLAPPELDGLAESLRRYALLAGRAHGIEVRLTAADVPELDPRVQAAAFRVAQEALHNALRHSGAGEVSLTLSRARGRVVLEVADDGTGFDPELAPPGLGLASMRERAAAVGGTLRVTLGPRRGHPGQAGGASERSERRDAALGRPGASGRHRMTGDVITVLLVDDHPVVRRGLRALLEVQDGIVVAGEAGDGPAAVSLAASLRPDIVLLDLRLPGIDGSALIEPLRAAGPRVLVLTSATEPSVAARAAAGGRGRRALQGHRPRCPGAGHPRGAATATCCSRPRPSARCCAVPGPRRSPRGRARCWRGSPRAGPTGRSPACCGCPRRR